MSDQGNIEFPPVNMGQALGVLADVVGSYVSAAHTAALADDSKKSAQLNLTIFLHSLLMRSKYPAEMAGLLDIISVELRAKASAQSGDGVDPTTSDLMKPVGNGGVVNAEICELALLLVGGISVTREMIDAWSSDQLDQAYDWAMRVHLSASDNDDVVVPDRPEFIPVRSASSDS